jgi:cell division protein FtsB
MKKPNPKNRSIINLLYILLAVFLLSWILIWGTNSFYHKWKLQRKARQTELKYQALKAQNDSLSRANTRLKTDPAAAEEVAREEHGLIKADETVYIFKQADADSLTQAGKGKKKD